MLLSVTAALLAGCTRLEEPLGGNEAVSGKDGRVTFTMSFDIPGATAPATKAMNEDASVENIYIAVFTYKNYLKEFVKAVPVDGSGNPLLNPDGSYNYAKTGGLYKVQFSLEKTTSPRYVHVLANVPEGIAPPDFDYLDKVLGEKLYTSGIQDGYWKYLEFSDGIQDDDSAMAKFNGIKLVRNFAQVKLEAAGSSGFTVKGFELYNTPTRGSFLPYQGKSGSDFLFYKDWENGENAKAYSDLIAAYPGYLIPGSTPLYRPSYGAGDFPADKNPKFMYEHPASPENPTYIIAKLEKDGVTKFYRLDILDNVGNKSAIIRNYIYTVTIKSITTDGYEDPATAEGNPSDYNFTLSEKTEGVDNIYNNGAMMETEYVEKVFTKAANDVTFKYRYDATANSDPHVPTYGPGELSDIVGGNEITPHWAANDAGTSEGDGWYGVTYDVKDPSAIGADEIESTFTVTAGTGAKKIVRKVHLISMKPKTLNVTTWEYNSTSHTLDLEFTIPDGLRSSMFPIHFKFQAKDKTTEKQILSPQTSGLVSGYDSNAKIYFLKDYYYADYQASASSKTITIQFKAPENLTPVLNLSDVDGYFVPQELGATYATGLSADPIANGIGNTTVFEFTYTNDTPVPITLDLENLVVDPSVCEGGSLSGNVFTPSGKGTKRIGLKSTTNTGNGTVKLETETTMTDPDVLTVQRYSNYVTGNLVLNGDLPLKEGSTTTFSFNYSARNMLPVTISAPEVEIFAEGNWHDGDYTFTPPAAGIQTFTIKAKTHFADAGSISLSVPYMTNPAALTITRGTTFVIPASALNLTGTSNFNQPVYWRTDKKNNTSGALGLSHYFNSSTNTGNVTIDISRIGTDENTKVYFMYTYTQYILIIPVTRYMFAKATLKQLIEATESSKLDLPFSLHL